MQCVKKINVWNDACVGIHIVFLLLISLSLPVLLDFNVLENKKIRKITRALTSPSASLAQKATDSAMFSDVRVKPI